MKNVEEGTLIAIGKGFATALARPGTFSATTLHLSESCNGIGHLRSTFVLASYTDFELQYA